MPHGEIKPVLAVIVRFNAKSHSTTSWRCEWGLGTEDWGLGTGDWGLGK
ncbi:hypothetical protein HCG51_26560 [Tolypothrix sp. PCC 7910]|nr:hypothetical protein [Tolypothrix sp. PCC 7910]QIR39920.1 hypothetical protein HCG51_26560 [Tolypothrix sp. PCC 7910]